MNPFFLVLSPRKSPTGSTTPFTLVRDNWDDFGFKTQYHLYFNLAKEESYIGAVRILKKGQGITSSGVLSDGLIPELDESFCSLGQSLDYYERIAQLPSDVREALLIAIRDSIAFPDRAEGFRKEIGWQTSVLRDIQNEKEFAQLASVLLKKDYASLPNISQDLVFQVAGWSAPLHLQFSAPSDSIFYFPPTPLRRYRLPQRITVITGRNGSGKSTLLSRLARILHASQSDRNSETLKKLGTIEPVGVGFTRIITVSYSAFDAFQVPGITREDRIQIARDLKSGTGRYYFCGLRDISRELENQINLAELPTSTTFDPGFEADRQRETFLKPITVLSDEFARAIDRIEEIGRQPLLEWAASYLLADSSFSHSQPLQLSDLLTTDPKEAFFRWSTGHKIVLHTLASMVAYTEPKSIVLFDEPEAHLHPPLLAALMHGIRHILEDRDAFAVVATHSPVVAQETLSRHVRIVRRVAELTTIARPKIETFGESIGEITDEVFGLNSDATDYHEILRRLLERLGSVEGVEGLFDAGLSLQGRAYLMTLSAARDSE